MYTLFPVSGRARARSHRRRIRDTGVVHNKRRCVFKFTRTAALERRRDRADRTWYRRRGRRRRWADATWVRRAYTVPACAYDVNKVLILCVPADPPAARRPPAKPPRACDSSPPLLARASPSRHSADAFSSAQSHRRRRLSRLNFFFFFLLPPSSSPADNISTDRRPSVRVYLQSTRVVLLLYV